MSTLLVTINIALLLATLFVLYAAKSGTRTAPPQPRAGHRISVLERRKEALYKVTAAWLESIENENHLTQEDLKKIMVMLEHEVATLEKHYRGEELTGDDETPRFNIHSYLDTNFEHHYIATCNNCAWEIETPTATSHKHLEHCPNCNT